MNTSENAPSLRDSIAPLARALRNPLLSAPERARFAAELLAILKSADVGQGLPALAAQCGYCLIQFRAIRRLLGLPGGATLCLSWIPDRPEVIPASKRKPYTQGL
jgi:hypothetical protein